MTASLAMADRWWKCLAQAGFDTGRGIAVDSAQNAYVSGLTLSTNFPTQRVVSTIVSTKPGVFGFGAVCRQLLSHTRRCPSEEADDLMKSIALGLSDNACGRRGP